jgi:hypothetical protein
MMGYHVRFIPFLFLSQVVQKEVYQNGVDLCVWFDLEDFSSKKLDTPDTASCIAVS